MVTKHLIAFAVIFLVIEHETKKIGTSTLCTSSIKNTNNSSKHQNKPRFAINLGTTLQQEYQLPRGYSQTLSEKYF